MLACRRCTGRVPIGRTRRPAVPRLRKVALLAVFSRCRSVFGADMGIDVMNARCPSSEAKTPVGRGTGELDPTLVRKGPIGVMLCDRVCGQSGTCVGTEPFRTVVRAVTQSWVRGS